VEWRLTLEIQQDTTLISDFDELSIARVAKGDGDGADKVAV
jgi:hypothetical protein